MSYQLEVEKRCFTVPVRLTETELRNLLALKEKENCKNKSDALRLSISLALEKSSAKAFCDELAEKTIVGTLRALGAHITQRNNQK